MEYVPQIEEQTPSQEKLKSKLVNLTWFVYDKDHLRALRIKITSESDPRLQIKVRKNYVAPTGYLRDTGAMLYRLSYEASLEAGQARVQFTPVI